MILSFDDYRDPSTFDCDVVVVGTGAGGAVVGTELAEAGRDVIFVEEGSYNPTSSFNPYLTESLPRLYRDAGVTVILGTPQIPYVEGRTVGGSTVINGGMAYRPPERVLAEWQRLTGTPEMGPSGLDALFRRVEARVQVNTQLDLSVGEDSRLMQEGARRLGWDYSVNRRNQEACVGSNNCTLGCPTGAKQSTLVSYLPGAFKAGARCLTQVRVTRLLIERGRAVGIVGYGVDPDDQSRRCKITVRARAVVIAGGAVQTPFLLQRHRLGRPSRRLGRNFLVHPNAKVVAVYPHEVKGWQGVSQAAQIREFHDEGILMAENFVSPGLIATSIPFHGREAWEFMRTFKHQVHTGVLVEDSTSGSVRRRFGMVEARYDLAPHDHRRFLRGIRLLAQLHFEMGAKALLLPFLNLPTLQSADDLGLIEATQTDLRTLELFTVHLMGTASMGSKPETSVVDLDGQLWDLPGCYVADASLFPTAIGVNPQITIMALATRVAERVKWPLPAR